MDNVIAIPFHKELTIFSFCEKTHILCNNLKYIFQSNNNETEEELSNGHVNRAVEINDEGRSLVSMETYSKQLLKRWGTVLVCSSKFDSFKWITIHVLSRVFFFEIF